MEITELREQLHNLVNTSSEEKLLEIYNLFEQDYSDEFKDELEEEYADYKTNGEIISREAVNEAIEFMLHGKNKP